MKKAIDVHAEVVYPETDAANYSRCPFDYYDVIKHPATSWEKKCLSEANEFLTQLFATPGFTEFFVRNHCKVKKEQVKAFLKSVGSKLEFPETREYHDAFDMFHYHRKHDNGLGLVLDKKGWIYDKGMTPKIIVTINGKQYTPFQEYWHDWESHPIINTYHIDHFGDYDGILTWRICMNSAYLVPHLYAIRENFNPYAMWEYGISLDDYPCTSKVLEYFQNEVLPVYNIIVDEEIPVVGKGQYKAYIVSETELRELIRANRKKIKEILGNFKEYEPTKQTWSS